MVTAAMPAVGIPSLEAALQAVIDQTTALFSQAAIDVIALSPPADAPLVPPAAYRIAAAGYQMPTAWPSLVLSGRNLRRTGQPDAVYGGDWRGDLELHLWAQDSNPDRLARTLHRQAATLWVILTAADAQRQLGGARLLPGTLVISPSSDAAQSLSQQSIILRVSVTLRA